MTTPRSRTPQTVQLAPADEVRRRAMKRRRRSRLEAIAGDEVADGFKIERRPGRPPVVTWRLNDDPLISLLSVEAVLREIEGVAGYLVMEGRREGFSWADIGMALQVSRQAAQKRYAWVDGVIDGSLVVGTDGSVKPS